MKLLLTLLCLSMVWASTLLAENIEEHVEANGYPIRQFIAVLQGKDIKLYRASLNRTEKDFVLSADVPNLDSNLMTSAVLELNDGQMISSAFHTPGETLLAAASSRLANERAGELEAALAYSMRLIAETEREIKAVNAKLRAEAGLTDVDRIYEKVEELESQIKALGKPAIE